MRRLIVNADDLGYDPEIDRGILEAHRDGIVTSCSAMVDTPFAAAALGAAPRSLGVGLHAVLRPEAGPDEAEAEIQRQLRRFRELRRTLPSHLDSHKHAHARADLLPAFAAAAAAGGMPLRSLDPAMREALRARGVATADAFLGDAALRPCWTLERLLAALAAVGEGTTELMAHPGHAPHQARTTFAAEREVELAALCHPAVREAVERCGIALAAWS